MDYLTEIYYKQCVIFLLTSFSLTTNVNFPTRIQNVASTATNSVSIDSTRKDHYSIKPVIKSI